MNEQQWDHANHQFQSELNKSGRDQQKRSAVLVAQAQFLLLYIDQKNKLDLDERTNELVDGVRKINILGNILGNQVPPRTANIQQEKKLDLDLVKKLLALIDDVHRSYKFRDRRVERMFSTASMGLAAITGAGAANALDGVRIVARSFVDEAANIQFGVVLTDPVSVIGWYMTKIVIPTFKIVTLVSVNASLLMAINDARKTLGLHQLIG